MKRFAAATALALSAFLPCSAADFDAAKSVNAVGLDLYRQLSSTHPTGNLVLSPYSIETALALVHAGAENETRRELGQVLRFPDDTATLAAGFDAVRAALDRSVDRSRTAAETQRRHGGQLEPIEFHLANRLFGQRDYAFRDSFLALLRDRFAAPFQPLDFRADPEASRSTINRWVSDQTSQKINELIPLRALDRDTRLILVNALYVKAPWAKPFAKTATRPRRFHLADGTAPEVSTMHRTEFLGYTDERDFVVVTLDYSGSGLQFVVILPSPQTPLADVASKLTPEHFARWSRLQDQTKANIALYLPKFRLTSATVPLGKSLRALGVRQAFDEPPRSADFSRIAPRKSDAYLALSEVFHQTFVEIDEEGTVAAAATAALMSVFGSAMPKPPIEVRVDRPFLFAIQERTTGNCLFLGRLNDPR